MNSNRVSDVGGQIAFIHKVSYVFFFKFGHNNDTHNTHATHAAAIRKIRLPSIRNISTLVGIGQNLEW